MSEAEYMEYAEDVLKAIEEEYGAAIKRIVRMIDFGTYFELTIIFNDYKLLFVEVRVKNGDVILQGRYY